MNEEPSCFGDIGLHTDNNDLTRQSTDGKCDHCSEKCGMHSFSTPLLLLFDVDGEDEVRDLFLGVKYCEAHRNASRWPASIYDRHAITTVTTNNTSSAKQAKAYLPMVLAIEQQYPRRLLAIHSISICIDTKYHITHTDQTRTINNRTTDRVVMAIRSKPASAQCFRCDAMSDINTRVTEYVIGMDCHIRCDLLVTVTCDEAGFKWISFTL